MGGEGSFEASWRIGQAKVPGGRPRAHWCPPEREEADPRLELKHTGFPTSKASPKC